MKKIILGFFLFCILGVSQSFAALQGDYVFINSVSQEYAININTTSTGTFFIINDVYIGFLSDTSPVLNGICGDLYETGTSKSFSCLFNTAYKTFQSYKLNDVQYAQFITYERNTNFPSGVNTSFLYTHTQSSNSSLHAISSLYYIGPQGTILSSNNLSLFSQSSISSSDSLIGISPSGPQLQCEEYIENVNTGVPYFTFEDMTSIVDLTSEGDYNLHLLEGYESFGVEYINTDNLSEVGFFETQSGSLTFDSYFRKKPIVTFFSWQSENSSQQPQYYFKLVGTASIDYVEYEMLDGTYKKEENFKYGETYYYEEGFYQAQVVYNNSFWGTYSIDSFVMGISEVIPTTKTYCHNPNTGENYIDGVLTDYESIDEVPKNSSEFDNENTAVFSDEYLNGLDSMSNFDILFDSMSGTTDIIGNTIKNAGTLTGTLGEYIPLVVLDPVKKTCEVFNSDGSFKYYSNGSFSFSIDIMTGTFFDNILFIPQKALDLLTLPINNVLALLRTISVVPDGTSVCFMGYIYEVEYQSIIPNEYDDIKFFGPVGDYVIYKGEKTFFDYFLLFFFGVFFFFISIQILKPKH